jgi:hypothetical protein
MKKALAIIKKKFTTEGFPIDREWALQRVLQRIESATIYQYGNTIFIVDADGVVHLYRDGGKVSLLEAAKLFMRDTAEQSLRAPIKNKRVMRLAEFFNWKCIRELPGGYKLYEVRK